LPALLGSVWLRQVRRALLIGLFLLIGDRAFAEDAFVLALTWQPGFCAERPGHAECKIAPKEAPRLTLHGLWPQWDVNGDGQRNADDDFCIPGAFDRKVIIRSDGGNWLTLPPVALSVVGSRMLEEAMPGTVVGLDRHEWWKHGTCSGLKAEDYFAASIARLGEVEGSFLARLLVLKAGSTVARQRLLEAFENDFGRGSARALLLDCAKDDGTSALQEIRIRLKRSGITQWLTAESLAIPAKAARGDCGAEILIPAWPH
jgi:ribonuclease T2